MHREYKILKNLVAVRLTTVQVTKLSVINQNGTHSKPGLTGGLEHIVNNVHIKNCMHYKQLYLLDSGTGQRTSNGHTSRRTTHDK
jgi:hypothetical protein